MKRVPNYLKKATEKVLASEPGLRLTDLDLERGSPFDYAVVFEPTTPLGEEEHADLRQRVSARFVELLGDRSLRVHWYVAQRPARARAS